MHTQRKGRSEQWASYLEIDVPVRRCATGTAKLRMALKLSELLGGYRCNINRKETFRFYEAGDGEQANDLEATHFRLVWLDAANEREMHRCYSQMSLSFLGRAWRLCCNGAADCRTSRIH